MAAHTSRTLLLAGAGVGLFAVASLTRRLSTKGAPRVCVTDRLPAPRRHRSPASPAAGSRQDVPGAAGEHGRAENEAARGDQGVTHVVPGALPRPLIPAQRKAS